MGMYTGLRGTITVPDSYVPYFDLIFNDYEDWNDINLPLLPFTKIFLDDNRSSFIPHGDICYMPTDWVHNMNKMDDNSFYFCCSLKNYEHTIQKFIDFLNEIGVLYHLEYLYEECEDSTIYTNITD